MFGASLPFKDKTMSCLFSPEQIDPKAENARRFIARYWPELAVSIPPGASFFSVPIGINSDGFSTHGVTPDRWIHSRGGSWFSTDKCVPEGYFACGLQNAGCSENLFLMWEKEGRRFSFYDPYVVLHGGSSASTDSTRENLRLALERWHSGVEIVVFGGSWGWYQPETNSYEGDDPCETGELGEILSYIAQRAKSYRPPDSA